MYHSAHLWSVSGFITAYSAGSRRQQFCRYLRETHSPEVPLRCPVVLRGRRWKIFFWQGCVVRLLVALINLCLWRSSFVTLSSHLAFSPFTACSQRVHINQKGSVIDSVSSFHQLLTSSLRYALEENWRSFAVRLRDRAFKKEFWTCF